MMQPVVLFEDDGFADLLPLTYWRPVCTLRLAAENLMEHSARVLDIRVVGVWVRPWMAEVAARRLSVPVNEALPSGTLLVNARWIPSGSFAPSAHPHVGVMQDRIAYIQCSPEAASRLTPEGLLRRDAADRELTSLPVEHCSGAWIRYPWDLISGLSDRLIEWCARGAHVGDTEDDRRWETRHDHVWVHAAARVHPTAVLDATEGPIVCAREVVIGAHSVIEGPVWIGTRTRIHPHAWLHGANAIGPGCKIGGEVDGCLFQGFANKQHYGFLGHSVVGEWVNLGAGTTNSDLKNTYGSVRVSIRGTAVDSECMLFGCVIGDHAKLGIHTAIPTGGVIGMAATMAASGTAPRFVPSFGWVTDRGVQRGDPARLLATARRVMARRSCDLTPEEERLFLEAQKQAAVLEST